MHHYRRRGGERAPEPQLTEATIATPFDLAKAARAAVQARDLKALERLLQRPEAAEMDDRSAAFVVRTAVEQHSASALGLLFAQPAVLGMGARAIAGLLQTAIRYKNVPAVLQLSKLEAAHDISPGYISYLLGEATTLGHAGVIQSLSMLQGHQTELEQLVPAGSIEGALRTAVLQGRRQMVFHMTESEGVLGLQPTAIAGILSTAVQHCSGIITRYLCWVPSAQQLPPDAVCSLLEAAVRAVDSQGLAYVCEALPGARQLGAEQSVRLLTAALQQSDEATTLFCRLAHLPGSQKLSPNNTAKLLAAVLSEDAAAEAGSVADRVCAVCALLPGARRLRPLRVLDLLRLALRLQDSAAVSELCSLPGAQQLSSSSCMELMQIAAEAEQQQPVLSASSEEAATEQESGDLGGVSDDDGGCGSCSSRCSTPKRAARVGSSDSSGSSSPVLLRRFSRSSATSSCSTRSSSPSSSELMAVLCQQLSGAQGLQPSAVLLNAAAA